MKPERDVFFVSDQTGISAHTMGSTLLTQFPGFSFQQWTLPFIDNECRAKESVAKINAYADQHHNAPLVFCTIVDPQLRSIIATCKGIVIDFFESFIGQVENALQIEATLQSGLAHGIGSKNYLERINAINYALTHDDGAKDQDYDQSEYLLLGPSRCAKTPITLYLAMQFGLFVANFPLVLDNNDSINIPEKVKKHMKKAIGLRIDPYRLSEIRTQRLANSQYASIGQCRHEIFLAEKLYRYWNIPIVDVTHSSIEEIATQIVKLKHTPS